MSYGPEITKVLMEIYHSISWNDAYFENHLTKYDMFIGGKFSVAYDYSLHNLAEITWRTWGIIPRSVHIGKDIRIFRNMSDDASSVRVFHLTQMDKIWRKFALRIMRLEAARMIYAAKEKELKIIKILEAEHLVKHNKYTNPDPQYGKKVKITDDTVLLILDEEELALHLLQTK